jgi:hypothetical protein
MGAKQRRVSELYTYLAAAYDGQDFPEVYSNGTNVGEFVENVNQYRIEVQKDNDKFAVYLGEIKQLDLEIRALRSIDQGFADKYKVSLQTYQETYASTELSQMDEYLRATGKSQALHLNAAVGYLEKVDEQAKELLDGWKRVEDNARKELIVGAILNVVDILTGIGIGGAGAVFLLKGRNLTKPEFTATRLFWDLGTNGGDVVDMASVALSTYNFYDNINRLGINKKSTDVLDWIQKKVDGITGKGGNFDILVEKLKDHAKWAEEERENQPPPNPFVPI